MDKFKDAISIDLLTWFSCPKVVCITHGDTTFPLIVMSPIIINRLIQKKCLYEFYSCC